VIGDGMPDAWEARYALDILSAADAGADADLDGVSNRDEYGAGTHPRVALLNSDPMQPAQALLSFQLPGGAVIPHVLTIPPHSRRTVNPQSFSGLQIAEFATAIESDVPLAVDRTMTWNRDQYGSHAETAVAGGAARWSLAEGATHSGSDLFYLLQNPNPEPVSVEVRFLRPSPAPVETRTYRIDGRSRFNVRVNTIAGIRLPTCLR
jgi:hypothetical protein